MAQIREGLRYLKAKLRLKCFRDSDPPMIKKKLMEEKLFSSEVFPVDVVVDDDDEERRRYLVPITSLSSPMLQALLNQFQEEILAQKKGPITLFCSTWMFESVRDLAGAAEKLD